MPAAAERMNLDLKHKRHLSYGFCLIYDREPYDVARWIDRRLRKHNMAWVQGTINWAKVVQLDDSKPLPDKYGATAERIWADSGTYRAKLEAKGRVSKDWFGGAVFVWEDEKKHPYPPKWDMK
jgi:hypothetical protein